MAREQLVDIYRGPTDPDSTGRGIYHLHDRARNLHIQRTIATVAQQIPANKSLNVLDIGCGSGRFLTEVVQGHPVDAAFVNTLSDNHISVHGIGLTDAPSLKEFNSVVSTHISNYGTAEIYAYTLTAAQTLERFIRSLTTVKLWRTIHVAMASYSLMYLSANVAEETILTVINNLKRGGVFFIIQPASYAGPLPAYEGHMAMFFRERGERASIINTLMSCSKSHQDIENLVQQPEWNKQKTVAKSFINAAHRIIPSLDTYLAPPTLLEDYASPEAKDARATLYTLGECYRLLREHQYNKQVGLFGPHNSGTHQGYLHSLTKKRNLQVDYFYEPQSSRVVNTIKITKK